MAKLGISTGTTPNDGTGDSLLDGAVKVNSNFDEVYGKIGDGTNLFVNGSKIKNQVLVDNLYKTIKPVSNEVSSGFFTSMVFECPPI